MYKLNEAAVLDIVTTLNMTPNKRSCTQSPREVITGKKVNAPRDIRSKFGKLVQVKVPNQPSNDDVEAPRVEDGIVVVNGSLRVFLLDNARIVSKTTVQAMPVYTHRMCST